MTQEELTSNKSKCCGCGACVNICPKKAISMQEDEYGFLYPVIDKNKCINCGLCKNNCAYQNTVEASKPKNCYISASKDKDIKMKSASGGIFATIASNFIKDGGIVYGCSMEYDKNTLNPIHIRVSDISDLHKLQGSKYVQSSMIDIYSSVKKDLKNNCPVLFSGTPCQIASLKFYLNKYDLSNLYTIDIICHGTPSARFFQSYIQYLEKKHSYHVKKFVFRDKTKGWSLKGKITFEKNKKIKNKYVYANLSSFYNLFLNAKIYRENCYTCKYATKNRVGDLTIGDFWGAEYEHSDILNNHNSSIKERSGISCILQNSEKGNYLLKKYGGNIEIFKSDFNKISKYNKQLVEPCSLSPDRKKIMEDYKNGGYELVEKNYMKKLGMKKIIYPFWNLLPNNIQKKIKK